MDNDGILVLNSGSSSLKFALYTGGAEPALRLKGTVDRIGHADARISLFDVGSDVGSDVGTDVDTAVDTPIDDHAGTPTADEPIDARDHTGAANALLDWLAAHDGALASVGAVGHRIVHGMTHTAPEQVTPALLDDLRRLLPLDPDHLPAEIALIEACMKRLPDMPHIACFDTAFHAGLPRVAAQLPIPRRYEAMGVRRYGFHGLSYAYLVDALARCESRVDARHRVVLAHLGSGASMAAVLDGRSIDTSMGFTPTAGLPMSTRSGDLDPGIAAYLAAAEQMSPGDFYAMASHASGLLGLSETSADMRDLLDLEATDVRAADAVAHFCYQARKCIGAYAAALGGIDTLVFSGGIGERAAVVRARICDGLGFLGIALDAERNDAHAAVISTDSAATTVRVIRTDEESMIARSVGRILRSAP